MRHMSIEKPDADDDDVRNALQAGSRQTSASHDDAVLRAAKAFADERASSKRMSGPKWFALAAGMAILGIALWLGWQGRQQGGSTPQLVAAVVLNAGMTRSGDAVAKVEFPATASGTVRLDLDLATVPPQPEYRAQLHTRAGRSVWSGDSLKPRTTEWGKAVSVHLDSSLLEDGEYELTLGQPEDPTYYYFNVQRRN
jgi:hypothetical protein